MNGVDLDLGEIIKDIDKSDIDAIFLFGSYTSGKVKPTSDIDICVITKRDIHKDAKEAIQSNSSKKIDLSIFWDLPIAIRYRILKEGKPLYVKDGLTLQRIKADTLRTYLDFQPVIRRHISRVLG